LCQIDNNLDLQRMIHNVSQPQTIGFDIAR